MHVGMQTRKHNTGVAIIANKSTIEMRNAEAAEESPEVSYAAVATSAAPVSLVPVVQRPLVSNAATLALQTEYVLVAMDTKGPAPAPAAAPIEVSPSREPPFRTGENTCPARSGNDDVADKKEPRKLACLPRLMVCRWALTNIG